MPFWIPIAILALICLSVAVTSNAVKHTRFTICSADLPESFDGYKIALITDLHDRYFAALPEMIDKIAPDAVMLGGDIHEDRTKDPEFFAMLKALTDKYEVFFAEGNHDVSYSSDKNYAEYAEKIRSTGVHLLQANEVLVTRNNEAISVSGVDWYSYGVKYPIHTDGLFSIDLLHDPNAFDTVPRRPTLMLSGHIHGGYIKIPFVGGLFCPGAGKFRFSQPLNKQYFPKYCDGLYCTADGASKLIVSVGMGFSGPPFRFIRPEIVTITLKKDEI